MAVGWDAHPAALARAGAAPPGPNPYGGFLDGLDAAFRAEMAAFLDLVAGRGENPAPARRRSRRCAWPSRATSRGPKGGPSATPATRRAPSP